MKTHAYIHYSIKPHKTGCLKHLLANLKLHASIFTTLKKGLVYYRIALIDGFYTSSMRPLAGDFYNLLTIGGSDVGPARVLYSKGDSNGKMPKEM